ncbi:MAG: hypothetical protein ACRDP3_17780 [Streptomyces sp.]|uniref:hypothetical protein n=1 Tax=Streptomyces sp. TaxID=1931 RepID=UPI003D6A354C
MSKIKDLWDEHKVPVDDALHFADGRSFDACVTPESPGGISILEPFDLDDRLSIAPNWVSVVDGLEEELEDGGFLWHGDGDNGSEGFFARVNPDRSLVWVVFFTDSNPFTKAEVVGRYATLSSTSGVVITIDIDDPRRPVPRN